MKNKLSLSINSRGRPTNKYAGDPGSPNFLPSSPLIDRQVLSAQVEAELQIVCKKVAANEQSADADLAVVAKYLAQKPQHDKHASFTFQPPKPSVLPPPQTKTPRKPSFINDDDRALHEIRSKLASRPKTSAAACVDYTDPTSPPCSNPTTSIPSNRTTSSTPFTSAAITPGQTSNRFSQTVPNAGLALEIEGADTTTLPKFRHDATTTLDPGPTAQARIWMAEQLDKRRRSTTHTPLEAMATKSTRPCHPPHLPPPVVSSRPPSRAASMRTNISKSIREYIRPGSANASIRSFPSNPSALSRIRQRYYAHKADSQTHKSRVPTISLGRNASRRRSNSLGRHFPRRRSDSDGGTASFGHSISIGSQDSSRRLDFDDDDLYFVDPHQFDLDRPLPPLPGLDSYREKPQHIGLMMKSLISSSAPDRDLQGVVIDENGLERVMSTGEEKKRQDHLARAVLEKMSTGSIGSVPTTPNCVTAPYGQSLRPGQLPQQLRPTSTAGRVKGRGARPMGGFFKRLGGKLGLGRG